MKLTQSQIQLLDSLYEIGSILPPDSDDVSVLLRAGLIRFKGEDEIKITGEGVDALMAIPEIAHYWNVRRDEWSLERDYEENCKHVQAVADATFGG